MEELKSLVARAQGGDLEAYGEIVRRYPESLAAEEALLYQQALVLTGMEPGASEPISA